MTYSESGVRGEICCDDWREEPRVGSGVLVQGVLVALRPMDALADQLLAHSGECTKGRIGVKGRPIEVLLCWLS